MRRNLARVFELHLCELLDIALCTAAVNGMLDVVLFRQNAIFVNLAGNAIHVTTVQDGTCVKPLGVI